MSMLQLAQELAFIDTAFEQQFTVPKPDQKVLEDPVREQLEAYNAHDLGRFMSCFADDVVFEDAHGTVLLQGHKQMFRVYSGVFAPKRVNAQVTNQIKIGSWVADSQIVRGLSGGEPEEVLVLYHVLDGLIRRVKLFR